MRPVLLLTLFTSLTSFAAETVLPLWSENELGPRVAASEATQKRIAQGGPNKLGHETNIMNPTLTVYPASKPNGAAVIVCPGGGYWFLSTVNEGTGVCEWLNNLGVTAFLLRYRTPTADEAQPFNYPVQDLQRALGIVRTSAAKWNVDPHRVGVIGFSAGANLVGHASWDRTPRTYAQKAEVDQAGGPDFTIFVYGGGFLNDAKTAFREGFKVPADAPPAFFVVAHDDKTNPIEAAELYLGYKRQNLPAELHIYSKGGHGFGTRQTKFPVDTWTQRAAEWMQTAGFLKESSGR